MSDKFEEIRRPKKQKYSFMSHPDENLCAAKVEGYNNACDDWIKYVNKKYIPRSELLSKERIEKILRINLKPTLKTSLNGSDILFCNYKEAAEAIYAELNK